MTETDAELIELLMIPSVGRVKASALYSAGYRTLEDISNADLEDLAKVPGIGKEMARNVLDFVSVMLGASEEKDPDKLGTGASLFVCPGCGSMVSEKSNVCSSCGIAFSDEVEEIDSEARVLEIEDGDVPKLFICPECGSLIAEDSKKCTNCGVMFDEDVTDDLTDKELKPTPEMDVEGDEDRAELFMCPNCGAFIPEEGDSCLNCGIVFEGEEVVGPEQDLLVCPMCNKELKAGSESCQDCGFDFTADKDVDGHWYKDKTELFMCPNCGAFISESADLCGSCGMEFSSDEQEEVVDKKPVKEDEPDKEPGDDGDGYWYKDEDGLFMCPNCGAFIPKDADNCQTCGIVFEGEEEADIKPKLDKEDKDGFWYKEEDGLFMCPNCGAFIPKDADNCQTCGIVFEGEEEADIKPKLDKGDEDGFWYKEEEGLFMCPNCGAFIPKDAGNCQNCGVVFEKEVEERPVEPVARTCPNCRSSIEPGMDSCQSCGLHFEVEEKDLDGFWYKDDGGLFVCPNCGTFISEKAKTCSQCGIVFEGIEEEELKEDIERPEEEFDRSLYLCPGCGAFMSATADKCSVCGTVTDEEEALEQVSDGETFQMPERAEELSIEIAAEIEDIEAETLEPPKKIEELQTQKAKKGISKDFLSRWDKKEDEAISLVRDFKKRWETTRLTEEEIEKELELDFLTVPEDPEEERLEEIEDALESTPDNAELWAEKASILTELGQQNDAIACLDKAAELDPDKGTTYKKKMLALLGVGIDEEEIDLSDLISLEKDGDISLDEELILERTEADIVIIDEKLALKPKDETLWQEKGELLERMGRYEEAIQCFDESIKLSYADLQQESRGSVFSLKKQQLTIGLTNGEGRVNGKINGLMSQRGWVNGQGQINGLVNGRGRVNGLINGLVNGRGKTNGLVNGGLINGQGRINGLVNGRGRTNGLVNGQGRVNGLVNGLVNGIGLVNGEGFINGRGRFHATGHIARSRRGWRYRVSWIVVLVALVLVIPMFSNLQLQSSAHDIAIDGNFSDWEVVPMFLDSSSDQIFNPDINILETKFVHDMDQINLFVRVEGVALGGQHTNASQDRSETVDSIVAFIDLDSDPATGYAADGLGAEMIMEIYGWDNSARSATAYRFYEDNDHDDWNGFIRSGTVNCAVVRGGLEARIALPNDLMTENTAPKVRMVAMNSLGYVDVSDSTMSPFPASLEIVAKGVGPDLLAAAEQDVVMAHIQARSYAAPSTITRMNFTITGSASTNDLDNIRLVGDTDRDGYFNEGVDETLAIGFRSLDQNNFSVALDEPLEIPVNEDVDLLLVADIDAGSHGRTVGLLMNGAFETTGTAETLVSVKNINRIIHNIGSPTDIEIDGAFGDWAAMSQNVDAANDVVSMASGNTLMNKNVDLADMRFGLDDDLLVYLSVSGVLMGGSDIPTVRMRPGPPPNLSTMDSDRDTVPDTDDLMPHDFDNDGVNDTYENGDLDNDGIVDFRDHGTDYWLNTTIPDNFPANYSGRNVSVYVGPISRTHIENLGEDHAYIMVDSDDDPMTGLATHGAVGADHVIVISGKHNEITGSELYRYDTAGASGPWTFVDDVASALDWYRMELGVDLNSMGIAHDGNFSVFVSLEDWKGDSDVTDSTFDSEDMSPFQSIHDNELTRSPATNVVLNEISAFGPTDWIELANPLPGQVDLSGWTIRTGGGGGTTIYTFPAGTTIGAWLSGSEYLIVDLGAVFPNDPPLIRLFDSGGAEIDGFNGGNLKNGETHARKRMGDTGYPDDDDNNKDWYKSKANTKGGPNDKDAPKFKVKKADDADPVDIGDTLTYTIEVENKDKKATTGTIWVNDTFPAGLVYISDTASGVSEYVSNDTTGNPLLYEFTGLGPKDKIIFDISFLVTSPIAGLIWNTVDVEGVDVLGIPIDPKQAMEDTVVNVAGPYPATVKDAKDKIEVGKDLTYTITIENIGTEAIGYLWVNDTLPFNLSHVSDTAAASPYFVSSTINSPDLYFEFSNLPVGGIIEFDIVTFVGAMNATTITNTVNVDYTNTSGGPQPPVNASWDTLIQRPQITVEKTVNMTAAMPGDFLTYTIYFNNTGDKDADTVWINDTLPAGVNYISDTAAAVGTLSSSDTTGNPLLYEFTKVKKNTVNSFTIVVQVDATPPPILTNVVDLDYERKGVMLESSSDTAVTVVPIPEMQHITVAILGLMTITFIGLRKKRR